MKKIVKYLLMFMFCTGYCLAVEIESKDGRKFNAKIISATDTDVKVARDGDSTTFTLMRANLSLDTNTLIDQFRNIKIKSDLTSEGYTKMSFPQDKERAMWIKLPDEAIEIVGENGLAYVKFIRQKGNMMTIKVMRPGNLEKAEKIINEAKELRRKSSHSQATSKELDEFNKINNIDRVKYGQWEGFFINHSQKGLIEVALVDGENMLHAWVDKVSLDNKSIFNTKNFPEIIASIKLIEDKE